MIAAAGTTRNDKDGTPKAATKIVTVPVPPPIDRRAFDAVQKFQK